MTFADVSAALLASNQAGMADRFAILHLSQCAPPPKHTPQPDLARASVHALPCPAHPKHRTVRAVLEPCGEPRHTPARARPARRRVAPPHLAPRPASTLRPTYPALPWPPCRLTPYPRSPMAGTAGSHVEGPLGGRQCESLPIGDARSTAQVRRAAEPSPCTASRANPCPPAHGRGIHRPADPARAYPAGSSRHGRGGHRHHLHHRRHHRLPRRLHHRRHRRHRRRAAAVAAAAKPLAPLGARGRAGGFGGRGVVAGMVEGGVDSAPFGPRLFLAGSFYVFECIFAIALVMS